MQAASRPFLAAGNSTRRTISQRLAPSAIAASRYESGTARRASSEIETIIGTAIRAMMMPAVSRLTPPSSGPMTSRPMKPQTIDGIAASSSIRILRVSLTLPLANSEM